MQFYKFQININVSFTAFKLIDLYIVGGVTVEDAEIYFPQETPKTSGIKRPTRSTPGSANNPPPSKRRK